MNDRKICLITGANDGIGKQTAIELAKNGFQIGMICRNEKKGINAQEEIKMKSNNEDINLFICDLMYQNQLTKLSEEIKASYPSVDVLINNAASVFHSCKLTSEGVERQIAVNHIAPFFLTHLLLSHIRKSKQGRIITVSSNSHYGANLDMNNFFMKRKYMSYKMYERTKLCNVLFSNELSRFLEGSNITSNSVHPGLVDTKIGGKGSNFLVKLVWEIVKLYKGAISIEEGAKTSVYAASNDDVVNLSGKYFVKCKVVEPHPLALDKQLAKELWNTSLTLCNINHYGA